MYGWNEGERVKIEGYNIYEMKDRFKWQRE